MEVLKMSASDRLKYLRQSVLNLTQDELSLKIGLSRSALASIETGRSSLTDRNITSICSAFRVSESWLRTGEGEIYDEANPSAMDVVAEQYDLSGLERRIIEKFLSLSPDNRAAVAEYMASIGAEDEEDSAENTIDAQMARAEEVLRRRGL
jgi:transcriptional regulator with XRE-family HTH domain